MQNQSAKIVTKQVAIREQVKQGLSEEQRTKRLQLEQHKKKKVRQWEAKTSNSPFRLNLVAENERIDEENRIRLKEESRRSKLIETRKTKVKNEIILKALSEQSDLDALRREKRAIQLEEKRLRALLDLEKTNGHRKQDLLAAQRAERHRKQQEVEYRRKQKQNELQETQQRTTRMLKEKLAVPDAAPTTFTSFDSRS